MGLFGKKKPKEPDTHEKRYTIPYSKNFRGFKKYHVTVHGHAESEKNNKLLCNSDIIDPQVEFVCFDYQTGKRMAQIFFDGLLVGAIFPSGDPQKIAEIENGDILAIHAEKDLSEGRLKLFVKYKDVI